MYNIGTLKTATKKIKVNIELFNKCNKLCILVLKGAHTIVLYKDKGFVNSTGNPGMATGGSGDVLTGMIAGLIAQGYAPIIAAIFGVYLHGSAGDLAVEILGYQSLTATSIADAIGSAYLELFRMPEQPQAQQENSKDA